MDDNKRRSQSHSEEYDWLGPDNKQHIQGKHIPILRVFLITPTPAGPAPVVLPIIKLV